ncbi:MAG: crossover junction endodeoxyribonuclease RuvC [Candidatus Binatia bacterium]
MVDQRAEIPLRVLGVDPGTLRTGWGVVERRGQTLAFCAGGVISPKGFRSLPERLRVIHAGVVEVIDRWAPHVLSIEKAFVAYNVQSAFRLGEARGVVLLAAAQAGLRITDYNPTEIKTAVVGYGRADKQQVQEAVGALLGRRGSRETLLPTSQDATDALAAALCHFNSSRLAERIQAASSMHRGSSENDQERVQLLRNAFLKRALPRTLGMQRKTGRSS